VLKRKWLRGRALTFKRFLANMLRIGDSFLASSGIFCEGCGSSLDEAGVLPSFRRVFVYQLGKIFMKKFACALVALTLAVGCGGDAKKDEKKATPAKTETKTETKSEVKKTEPGKTETKTEEKKTEETKTEEKKTEEAKTPAEPEKKE
jgi:hypothetical protein